LPTSRRLQNTARETLRSHRENFVKSVALSLTPCRSSSFFNPLYSVLFADSCHAATPAACPVAKLVPMTLIAPPPPPSPSTSLPAAKRFDVSILQSARSGMSKVALFQMSFHTVGLPSPG